MNKIVLLGIRDLATDETIEPQTEYGLFLIAERISEEKEDQHSNDEPVKKYRLKVDRIDSVMNLKTKSEIKIEKGKTKSQKWRFIVEKEIGDYDSLMDWLIANQNKIFEMYKEDLSS